MTMTQYNGNRRWGLMCAVALGGLGLACANEPDESGPPWCDANADCYNGQMCQDGLCVSAQSSASGGSASGGSASGGSASGGSATGGSATGVSTTGSGTNPSGGGDDAPPDTCNDGDFTCADSTIEACEDGELVQYGCDEVCASNGWTTAGCDGMQCACDGYLDTHCILGAQAFCVCLEATGESCDDAAMQQIYLDCFEGNAPEIDCFADYVSDNQVDCVSAVGSCL